MDRVVALLAHLRDDKLLQDDLKDSEVIAAINHWTNRVRLPVNIASERFTDNYRIEQTLNKLSALQRTSREAGIAVPINALFAGSTDPFFGTKKKTKEANRKVFSDVQKKCLVENNVKACVSSEDNSTPIQNDDLANKLSMEDSESGTWRLSEKIGCFFNLSTRNITIWWTIQIVVFSIIFSQGWWEKMVSNG